MVLHLSNLEPNFCEIQDLPAPSSNNNDQDKIGYGSMKKQQHPRTEENGCDDAEDMEFARKKRAKKNNSETEDHSCFVALVTSSNLQKDALYLPKDFSSPNGLKREFREIVLTNGGERAWALDLRFDDSSGTFYISRGWRSFCDENRKKAGGLFVFKLLGKGEMPLLSFCPAESRGDKSSKKESLPLEPTNAIKKSKEEKQKNHLRCRDSTPPSLNRYVTLTFTRYSDIYCRQRLPLPFLRENGMDKPGMITLLGNDGTKWLANLRREERTTICLGKGWKEFAKANGLKTGEAFIFEAIWENGTPMLRLVNTDSKRSFRQQEENCSEANEKDHVCIEPSSGKKISKEEIKKNYLRCRDSESRGEKESKKVSLPEQPSNGKKISKGKRKENHLRCRDSTSPSQNRFVTLTLTHDSLRSCRLHLPLPFMRENGVNKPGMITILGKDGTKWLVNRVREEATGRMSLRKGWREFANANGLKIGESFTLELIWKGATPTLSLFSTESTSSRRQQGEYCSKASEIEHVSTEPSSENNTKKSKNSREEMRESSRLVTLTLTLEAVRDCTLILPSQFMKANGINKLGKITLLGKDKMKWFAYLLSKDGIVALGCGWKEFCEANGVKTGESFTLEFIHEQDTSPVFEFCPYSSD